MNGEREQSGCESASKRMVSARKWESRTFQGQSISINQLINQSFNDLRVCIDNCLISNVLIINKISNISIVI